MKPHLVKHSFVRKPAALISFIIPAAAAVLLSALLSGCAAARTEPVSRTEFHLDTVVSITLYDTQGAKKDAAILDGCMSLIEKYELLFSRTDAGSELYKLNHGLLPEATEKKPAFHGQIVSGELAEVIRLGLDYGALSGGALDITIAPVSDLWNFSQTGAETLSGQAGGASSGASASHAVPDAAALADARGYVNYRNVILSQTEEGHAAVYLKEGMSIDLGAVAKGYIADRLREYLLENGVENAIINLGGNVLCMGSKNGQPYRVGIQKPFAAQGEAIMILSLTDISLVSSGTYERYFEEGGHFYHHILDPATGYPCQNGLSGVTVLADSSAEADALSTACFLLGPEKGLSLIESLPDAEALFITDTEKLICSSGFPR